jgi:hypothetical protein
VGILWSTGSPTLGKIVEKYTILYLLGYKKTSRQFLQELNMKEPTPKQKVYFNKNLLGGIITVGFVVWLSIMVLGFLIKWVIFPLCSIYGVLK